MCSHFGPDSRPWFLVPDGPCRVLLSDRPDIVIGTPSKVLALLQAKVAHFSITASLSDHPKTLSLSNLDSLVIDEADLILSYGHNDDIRSIFAGNFLPKVYQSFLMSATMTEDVETLKSLALRSPVRLCSILILGHLIDKCVGDIKTGRR